MKKITAILAALAVAIVFVGCGPKDEAADVKTSDKGAEGTKDATKTPAPE